MAILEKLRTEIESTEIYRAPRDMQKALVQEWAEMAISAFADTPSEEWRRICVGEALTATLAGLYSLARQALYDATGDSRGVSPLYMGGVTAEERKRYSLANLPEMLRFVASYPAQPHPALGFRESV